MKLEACTVSFLHLLQVLHEPATKWSLQRSKRAVCNSSRMLLPVSRFTRSQFSQSALEDGDDAKVLSLDTRNVYKRNSKLLWVPAEQPSKLKVQSQNICKTNHAIPFSAQRQLCPAFYIVTSLFLIFSLPLKRFHSSNFRALGFFASVLQIRCCIAAWLMSHTQLSLLLAVSHTG